MVKKLQLLPSIPQQEFVGSGGLGQIYLVQHPSKPGQDVLKKKFHRIQHQKQWRPRFVQISRMLHSIDPSHRNFTGLLEPESPQHLILMSSGGISLDKLRYDGDMIRSLFINFPSLLEGLVKLGTERWVHGDIKLANIVRDPVTGMLRFIDYDFFTTAKEYSEGRATLSTIRRDVLYIPWPFERSWDARQQRFLWSSNELYKGLLHFYGQGFFSNGVQLERTMYALQHIHEKVNHHGLPHWVVNILEYYHRKGKDVREDVMKIDIYGLGIVAYTLFLSENRYKHLSLSEPNLRKLRAMIDEMIDPDPKRRRNPHAKWRYFIEDDYNILF